MYLGRGAFSNFNIFRIEQEAVRQVFEFYYDFLKKDMGLAGFAGGAASCAAGA
jgi:hypothetical protein